MDSEAKKKNLTNGTDGRSMAWNLPHYLNKSSSQTSSSYTSQQTGSSEKDQKAEFIAPLPVLFSVQCPDVGGASEHPTRLLLPIPPFSLPSLPSFEPISSFFTSLPSDSVSDFTKTPAIFLESAAQWAKVD
jgi:hypothetical protein